MDRSPVRRLEPDFDFSIEPDTPDYKEPPTKRYKPVPHRYAFSFEKTVFMTEYTTLNGRIIKVEYRPLKPLGFN